jgi:hypothetical protein
LLLALGAVARKTESRAQIHDDLGQRFRARGARRSGARIRRLIVRQVLASEAVRARPGAPSLDAAVAGYDAGRWHDDEFDTVELPVLQLLDDSVGGAPHEHRVPVSLAAPTTRPVARDEESAAVSLGGFGSETPESWLRD